VIVIGPDGSTHPDGSPRTSRPVDRPASRPGCRLLDQRPLVDRDTSLERRGTCRPQRFSACAPPCASYHSASVGEKSSHLLGPAGRRPWCRPEVLVTGRAARPGR
jgi:hypothetical protein